VTRQELEALIKKASDRLRADDNTKLVTKYIEHLSWLLFLKVHEALEDEQEMLDPDYKRIITGKYRWSKWTSNKWRADELITFVNAKLFPHLRALDRTRAGRLIATLFSGVTTVMKSGFGLKEVIGIVDKIDFHAPQDAHTFSVVYESLLARLGRDASWSGEFYTPRPIVRFMVRVVAPKLGERVYDPAAGSAGFLAEAFEHMRAHERTLEDYERLRTATFFGQESGELPFLLATMNMILHGVTVPNLVRRNTLEEDIRGISPDRQYDVILTNPPFGGRENPQIQQNFPAKSSATEVLFLQHVMAFLKAGGRVGIVVPDGVLFRADGGFAHVRSRLVDDFNVTAIVRLPLGAFPFAPDTRTNLLFFSKQPVEGTIRYYQVKPPPGKRAFTKTRSVTDEVLAGALAWVVDGIPDAHSWEVSREGIRAANYDLDLQPPEVTERLDPKLVSARVEGFSDQAQAFARLIVRLLDAANRAERYRLNGVAELGAFIEERGPRSGDDKPERFIGVSNAGGLVRFKGAVARDTSRYRRVEPGDFVYNPMRINVGSIALCCTDVEAGHASPDYVVFCLKPDAPFSPEYLLRYLQSSIGLRQIQRNAQGTIRSRLYFNNLCHVQVPVPAEPDDWNELLSAIDQVRRPLVELPELGTQALNGLLDSLFLWTGSRPVEAEVQEPQRTFGLGPRSSTKPVQSVE
jgi:type I restriction enzyme M protein